MAENGTRAGRAFVAFITTRPLLSLLLGAVLLALLVPGIQRLRAEFTYRVWFAEGDPLLATFDDFERRFGNDDSAIVIVHSPSGVFDVESATLLRALTERLWTAPEVIRVDSLAIAPRADMTLVTPPAKATTTSRSPMSSAPTSSTCSASSASPPSSTRSTCPPRSSCATTGG